MPPRSSHVRLGDVSSFLIQQGVEERLMENRQHDGVVVMVVEDSSRASPSTAEFTKMDVGEGGQRRGTNVCGCPPSASLYIGGGEGRGRPRVTP